LSWRFVSCQKFDHAVPLKCAGESVIQKMSKKNIVLIVVASAFLALGACSRPKEETSKAATPTPDPNLPKRMEKQHDAINRAAEQMKKEEEGKAAPSPSLTPAVSP
jgi:hypothetical protein